MKSKCILKMFSFLIILSCSLYSQTPKIRIACVGNSITQGFGPNDIRSYPQQLGQLLGGHYFVKNYGVGGRTLLRNGDYPYWNESAFLEAQDFKSDILIISLGTNDSKPQNWIYKNDFYSDYMNMIRQFRRDGRNPQIFVCFPTPVVKDNFGISNSVIHNEIIPLIDSVRKTSGTYLIDYYNNMPVVDSLYSDGVHPTEEGYKIMAQIAYMAIAKSPSGLIRFFYSGNLEFEKGETVKLFWEATPGSGLTINGISVADADSMEVQPEKTTVYSLISKGIVSDTASITVKYLAPPDRFFLDQNYPNPFNQTTLIRYDIPRHSRVTIMLFDILGRKIASLADQFQNSGRYELIFDGSNLDSGVYILRMKAGQFSKTLKLMLLK